MKLINSMAHDQPAAHYITLQKITRPLERVSLVSLFIGMCLSEITVIFLFYSINYTPNLNENVNI